MHMFKILRSTYIVRLHLQSRMQLEYRAVCNLVHSLFLSLLLTLKTLIYGTLLYYGTVLNWKYLLRITNVTSCCLVGEVVYKVVRL